VLVCGGLSGTMEAASKGRFENGGTVIGFLPGDAKADANPYVHIAVPTAWASHETSWSSGPPTFSCAFPGSFGTLSEIGLALNLGKTV